ncbi:hypothetical protein NLU13_0146 [Sarocladium strictum]|uniref:Phospholipase D-like domain-containing protein n=1 Tax=Sarocladium strictum TaxID=5046 RepID=A0AA39GR98_SARSR|nr:hypothetical protein NLU13_0146 [Sarocladium strictum]
MLSQYILDLCQNPATVSSELDKAPNLAPADVVKRLYKHNLRPDSAGSPGPRRDEDIELALQCGRWRERPSALFLKAFADALSCLNTHPLAGMVSPPLMGSHGTMPLTIIAPLADVARHCARVIREAKREVFFVTCVWSPSEAQQNEAWLSLIRNAERDIFIQTPDLNADPLLPALAEARARGVAVTYYFCFGYNDAGEMIPGQGGTNEQAARKLYTLAHAHARADPAAGANVDDLPLLLRVHAYVAKDQDHPVHQSLGARSCHLKLLIVDGAVGVQGSGNQDTQSWCHSQELNVMVDSRDICARWRDAVERNQRTSLFGRVGPQDGVWRDARGEPGRGYSGDPGVLGGLLKGVAGMMQKTIRHGVVGRNACFIRAKQPDTNGVARYKVECALRDEASGGNEPQ